ncbi:MAG: hypothetical protein KAV82_14480, partial [Phycisphaerae bacterium]|nr:hypothetical protein [Phycisphaerae bacterium]
RQDAGGTTDWTGLGPTQKQPPIFGRGCRAGFTRLLGCGGWNPPYIHSQSSTCGELDAIALPVGEALIDGLIHEVIKSL